MPTPNHKQKFKDAAQIRALTVFMSGTPAEKKRIDTPFYVEGYAARYDPYVLYYDPDGEPVYERFERGCFDSADMSDIIYQYDHAGRVFASTGNGSLIVEPDSQGHYGDVAAGMVTKMSWRFRCGDYYWDEANRTIVHRTIAKVYDVSAVSIPANDNTEINARAWVEGEIAQAARREAELDERRRRLCAQININIKGV